MFSYSAKVQLVNPRKVYSADPALVKLLTISKTEDTGKKLENIVYLHLRRKHDEIYYFDDKGECDFVGFNRGKPESLVQVCAELNADNLAREVGGLRKAMEFFKVKEGTIVTLADADMIEEDAGNIKVIPVFKYLS
jgi:predicted AAA+ superfamily ATPase